MTTKLAYVLTCALEATYIEQALMAVFSARHWNPDAHIVLLTDDKTSAILHCGGPRSEILQYINEEIVSTFDDGEDMVYRSRWIKTKVRELVTGDFLFIDCDTICCRSLADVDNFKCEVGAVLESHLPIAELNLQMQSEIEAKAQLVGWSISTETQYFSSGVLYVKDTDKTHQLYSRWHETWEKGVERGINIDQPTLAKANIDCGHIIQLIPDSYNRILFTETPGTREAHILHIAAFRNPSILFERSTLLAIRENGVRDCKLRNLILHPCCSFRPYDYDILHSSLAERIAWTKDVARLEGGMIKAVVWMLRTRVRVLHHKNNIRDNACRRY